jgi:hypothetical protein
MLESESDIIFREERDVHNMPLSTYQAVEVFSWFLGHYPCQVEPHEKTLRPVSLASFNSVSGLD